MKTTLKKIRAHNPCADGWEKLLKKLGKTKADDDPLDLLTILESNGLDDALWCFRAVDGHDREMRLFGVWCARQVQHLMTDQRSIDAIDVAERFANGNATIKELNTARDAAWSTSRDAAWAAAGDAGAAAGDAVRAAARAAARAVAGDAARAAWAAAGDAGAAARDAAWAAWTAARAAVLAAARAAVLAAAPFAARDAARAARDAAGDARYAAESKQEEHLREILKECGK